jgi:hypothetical protein
MTLLLFFSIIEMLFEDIEYVCVFLNDVFQAANIHCNLMMKMLLVDRICFLCQ